MHIHSDKVLTVADKTMLEHWCDSGVNDVLEPL
jgi:hypothetical protein